MEERKRCGRCQEMVPVGDFGKNRAKADGLQANCKPCVKLINADHYQKSKGYQNPKRMAVAAAQIARNRAIVLAYLNDHSCVDCGERDIVVLQFDHLSGKTANVSTLIRSASVARLNAEILKCEVVCANCHTRRTAATFDWWRVQAATT